MAVISSNATNAALSRLLTIRAAIDIALDQDAAAGTAAGGCGDDRPAARYIHPVIGIDRDVAAGAGQRDVVRVVVGLRDDLLGEDRVACRHRDRAIDRLDVAQRDRIGLVDRRKPNGPVLAQGPYGPPPSAWG